MRENPELSIIILNYNGKEYLKNCLSSIFSNDSYAKFEVILVDNASTDHSVDLVRKQFPQVHIIENSINYGFTKGNNIGIRKSRGEYCLILNNDTEFLSGSLKKARDFIAQSPPLTVACCKILNFDGTPQVNCRRFPNLFSEYLKHAFLKIKYIDNPISRRQILRTWERDEVQQVDWASGCFLLTRKKDMEKLGLFDEKFFIYYDDTDLCMRFHKAGGQVLYYPFSVIKHKGAGIMGTRKILPQSNLYGFQSAVYYFRKHHGKIHSILFRLLTEVTWIINLLLLALIDILSLLQIPKIREKERTLIYVLTRYKNIG
jgi:GT2 family glycosyltransferase